MSVSSFLKSAALIVAFLLITAPLAFSQTDSAAARKWVKSGTWKSGLQIKADPSVNAVEFEQQYKASKAVWDKVFAYLKNQNLETLAPGKYPIDGDNAFAIVTEAPSKTPEQAMWESHRKYIDLHYVIRGQEKIEVAPVTSATVIKPYDTERDAANYTATGTLYTATPKVFFLFFPEDAHRANLEVEGYDVVKKLVIKIKIVN